MIDRGRLLNSHIAHGGAIDKFGTVWIIHDASARKHREEDDVRLYSPILQEYADGDHRAVLEGATVKILYRERVVTTLTHRQLEPTGPQLDWRVSPSGFVFDRKSEGGSLEFAALEDAAAGRCPDVFNEHPRARVDSVHADRSVVMFWLDDDYAVVFTPDGTPIEAVVEYPLARATWTTHPEPPTPTVH